MTVIAWDGKTLAADRLAMNGYIRAEATKIFKLSVYDSLVGLSGNYDSCMAVLDWLEGGRKPTAWPAAAQSSEGWTRAIEIRRDGTVIYYERHPFPLGFLPAAFHAIGAGGECALGAMAMGATAQQAVEVACKFITGCGGGVDTLTF